MWQGFIPCTAESHCTLSSWKEANGESKVYIAQSSTYHQKTTAGAAIAPTAVSFTLSNREDVVEEPVLRQSLRKPKDAFHQLR